MREIILQKLNDALRGDLPSVTRRDIRLPRIPNKVHSVIGMRRAGKTCFLHPCQRDLLAGGAPRDSLVYFNFEDDRLADMGLP